MVKCKDKFKFKSKSKRMACFSKKAMSAVLSAAMVSMMMTNVYMPAAGVVYAAENAGDENGNGENGESGSSGDATVASGGSLTVNNAVAGHNYRVYQIFTGNVNADGTTLSNIKYGSNYGETGVAVPKSELEGIEDAKAFAKKLASDNTGGGIAGEPIVILTAENTSAQLEPGYYLVIDEITDGSTNHGDAVSDFIVEVVGNKTFTPKSTSVPTFDKMIDNHDENGNSTGGEIDGQEPVVDEKGTVTVSYVNEDGDMLADSLTMDGIVGEMYNTEEMNFDGYVLYKIDGGRNGKFSSGNHDVAYTYTTLDRLSVAPQDEIKDWRYTLDEDNDTITLIQYINNTNTEVTVYDAYPYNGKVYRTKIASYADDMIGDVVIDGETINATIYMFAFKNNLQRIHFESHVDTSETYRAKSMFDCCRSLTDVNVQALNTSNITDMSNMFIYCDNIPFIDVSGFDTQNVTDFTGMFHYCEKLSMLDVSGFDTRNAKSMRMMFASTALENIDVSNFDTGNVIDMNGMFAGCAELKTIDVSNFDTGNVIDMSGTFMQCYSLDYINVSGFDTSNVTRMEGMFSMYSSSGEQGCLGNIDVSNFDTSNVTDMASMFQDYTGRNLDVSNFNTENVEDMHYMFKGCKNIETLDLSNFDTQKVTEMYGMFQNCESLENLNINNFSTINNTRFDSMFAGCLNIKELNLRSFTINESLNPATFSMFKGCQNLQKVAATRNQWVTDPYMFTDCNISDVEYDDETASVQNLLPVPVSMAAEENADETPDAEDNTDAITPSNDTDTTVKYGIGDSVPFRLTAVMPESISAYDSYKLVFHDTMSDGMTYNEGSLKVFAGDTEISADNYTLNFDGQSFTVTINDVKADPYNAVVGSEIVVKYTATLNDSALFRNLNDAYLQYSNNPNDTSGMGTTVSDEVTAFTFTVEFDKVDGKSGDALDGAGFTLYKKNDSDGSYAVIRDEVTGSTAFSFSGLGAGDYKLVESTTPDGYNTMEDLEFSIVADSKEDADGNAYVTVLKIVSQGSDLNGEMIDGWQASVDTGILNSDIANFKGSELPSTGGIGTTVFYAVGGLIVLAVCIVLIRKRKEQTV